MKSWVIVNFQFIIVNLLDQSFHHVILHQKLCTFLNFADLKSLLCLYFKISSEYLNLCEIKRYSKQKILIKVFASNENTKKELFIFNRQF